VAAQSSAESTGYFLHSLRFHDFACSFTQTAVSDKRFKKRVSEHEMKLAQTETALETSRMTTRLHSMDRNAADHQKFGAISMNLTDTKKRLALILTAFAKLRKEGEQSLRELALPTQQNSGLNVALTMLAETLRGVAHPTPRQLLATEEPAMAEQMAGGSETQAEGPEESDHEAVESPQEAPKADTVLTSPMVVETAVQVAQAAQVEEDDLLDYESTEDEYQECDPLADHAVSMDIVGSITAAADPKCKYISPSQIFSIWVMRTTLLLNMIHQHVLNASIYGVDIEEEAPEPERNNSLDFNNL
jgi:hypothetical protein